MNLTDLVNLNSARFGLPAGFLTLVGVAGGLLALYLAYLLGKGKRSQAPSTSSGGPSVTSTHPRGDSKGEQSSIGRSLAKTDRSARHPPRADVWQQVMEDSPVMFFATDKEGTVCHATRSWLDFCGAKIGVSLEEAWISRVHTDDQSYVRAAIENASSSQADFSIKYRVVSSSGTLVWFMHQGRIKASSYQSKDLQQVAFLTDITELKKTQQALRKNKELAEAANLAKARFLANISHELHTPLTAILGYAENLAPSEQANELLLQAKEGLERNVYSLQNLIGDLLQISKADREEAGLQLSPVDLSNLLEEMEKDLQFFPKSPKVQFLAYTQGKIPRLVSLDKTKFKQSVMSLLSNAFRFTEVGRVELELTWKSSQHQDESSLFIRVKDTGCGIERKDRARIFQAFYQVDSSWTREHGGTGLGLALARRLASSLGGSLQLDSSTPGEGSVFCLEIPTEALSEERWELTPLRLATEQDAEPPRLDGSRLLVVDDSPDNQVILKRALSKVGAEVSLAGNGMEGLHMASREKFDLVLMDIQMPVMDGLQATQQLRQNNYDGPIVALTAHAFRSDREHFLAAGFDDFLTKPIPSSQLIRSIAPFIEEPRAMMGESALGRSEL